MLTISVHNLNGVDVLHCHGRLVRGEEQGLLCAASQLSDSVVLDMRDVEAIDAAGVGLLVSLQAAGIYLTLLNPSEAVRKVLRLTEVDSLFAIVNALDDAVPEAPFGLGPKLRARAAVPLAS